MSYPPYQQQLSTYTRSAGKHCTVHRPGGEDALAELLHRLSREERRFSLMGAGNSFGDVFLPEERDVIDLTDLDGTVGDLSEEGVLTVRCGMRSGPLSELLLNAGFHLPGSSGSLSNTVAGDIGSNVNGKDSWKHGNFCNNVLGFKLMRTDGEVVHVMREDAEVFHAVCGGLGMLGIITEVQLRARPLPAKHLHVHRTITGSLSETVGEFIRLDAGEWDFAYAWVDMLCGGRMRGRAIVEKARFDHGVPTSLPVNSFKPRERILGLSDDGFWAVYRTFQQMLRTAKADRAVARAVNAMRHGLADIGPRQRSGVPLSEYQYPMLKALPNWNKGISPKGFQEIQLLFSIDVFEEAMQEAIRIMSRHGAYPLICAIRRHLPDDGMLSFSGEGLSFTVNYDRANFAGLSGVSHMERELMSLTVRLSGKVYLSKFPYLTKDGFREMYPHHDRFKRVKEQLDPGQRLMSAAYARLFGD